MYLGRRAEIRNIGQEIERGAYTQSEGSGNLECPHRIFDVVEHVIDIRPTGICIEDFEGRCRILQSLAHKCLSM